MKGQTLSRRRFLIWSGEAASVTLLAACQPKVVEKVVEKTVVVQQEKLVKETVVVEKEKEVTKIVKEIQQVTPTPKPMEAVKLTVWYGGGASNLEAAKQTGKMWNEKNPTMAAEVISTPMGSMQTIEKLMAAIAGNSAPDLAHVDMFTVPSWGARLAFEDLTPNIEADGLDLRKEYFDFAVDEGSWKDHVYAIAAFESHGVFAWNKAHFEEAGIDPEKPPKSAEEMEAYADKLDKMEGGKIARIGYDPLTSRLSWSTAFAWAGCYKDKPGTNPLYDLKAMKCKANSPINVEAAEWRIKWIKRYGLENLDAFRSTFGGNEADSLGVGKVSMKFIGTWDHDMFKKYFPDLRLGVGPMPVPEKYGGTSDGTVMGAEGYAIPRGALAKGRLEPAWKCLRYFVGPEGQMLHARAGDNIVTLRSLANDEYMLRTPQYKYFMSQLACGWIRPPIPEGAMLWDELGAAENNAAHGKGEPQALLDEVAAKIDEAMEQWK